MVSEEFSESEFGVPFPGQVLPQAQWTRTALARELTNQPWSAERCFGRAAGLVVDLGCGNGRFLIGSALARPEYDHLGIDQLPVVIRYAVRRGNQRGLANLRFGVGNAADWLATRLAAGSVAELHVYHPQPYYRAEEVEKRLVTPAFAAQAHRALQPGGRLIMQTDNPGYWRYMQALLPHFFQLSVHTPAWPDAPRGRTRREILARQRGLPVYRAVCQRLDALDEAAALHLAQRLPLPVFDADRRLQALDGLA